MVGSCSAYNCKNRGGDLSFYSFPKKDVKRRKEWIRATRWENWDPSPNARLCSAHFESRYFNGRRLTWNAVPTIFNFPKHLHSKERKHRKVTLFPELRNIEYGSNQLEKLQPMPKPKLPEIDLSQLPWHPLAFNDDYCKPLCIPWEKDSGQNGEGIPLESLRRQGLLFVPKRAIKIKGRWEWLGVEVIGPLPATRRQRRFVLTVLDFYSKWVELFPMETCSGEEIAQSIYGLMTGTGYPYGFLCRMAPECVHEVNSALCKLVGREATYIVPYCQMGSMFRTTKALVDKMVFELTEVHQDDWDVRLTAAAYRMCCSVNPVTRQRPLSLHRSKDAAPFVKEPRQFVVKDGGDVTNCTFILKEPEVAPLRVVDVQCEECLHWSQISQPADIQEYERRRLAGEEDGYTCSPCMVLREERERAMRDFLAENSHAAPVEDTVPVVKTVEKKAKRVPAVEGNKQVVEEEKWLKRSSRTARSRPRWWENVVEEHGPPSRKALRKAAQKTKKGKKPKLKPQTKRTENLLIAPKPSFVNLAVLIKGSGDGSLTAILAT
ncbi:uncharacterized protein LOC134439807 [Engraulis encrasicolus]|uniref:uncharacterized protein LOC134439807 n=1 Tax=Engraulis encrasicolus TaxID=184585 RepID=UPI002FCF3755